MPNSIMYKYILTSRYVRVALHHHHHEDPTYKRIYIYISNHRKMIYDLYKDDSCIYSESVI